MTEPSILAICSARNKDTEPKPYFWSWARVTNSLKRYDPGCAKYRMIYGEKFIRLRRYKDPRTGEKKRTVEIEI